MKVNPVGKKLSQVEQAYLAGIIDGDGAIMACLEPHSEKKFRFRVRLYLKITYSKQEHADDVRRITGIGYVRQNRRTYEWVVRDQKSAVELLKSLIPFLRLKKKQAEIAVKIGGKEVRSEKDLQQVACWADTLASFNLRSRNRRKNYAAMIKESFSRND